MRIYVFKIGLYDAVYMSILFYFLKHVIGAIPYNNLCHDEYIWYPGNYDLHFFFAPEFIFFLILHIFEVFSTRGKFDFSI